MKKLILGLLIILSSQYLFAKEKVIAKVPEASGIVYSKISNTFFVVNDEGSIYELTKQGHLLRKKKLGNYDLEGISIDVKKDLLFLAVEGKDSILVLSRPTLEIKKEIPIKRKYKGKKILKKSGDGIEGLAFYDGYIYAANQSKKRYPKADSSVIVISKFDYEANKLKINSIIPMKITDISGLTFYKDELYILSDSNNLLMKYDLDKQKIVKKKKLSKRYAQEGITFDDQGNIYIADDNGKVLKLKR